MISLKERMRRVQLGYRNIMRGAIRRQRIEIYKDTIARVGRQIASDEYGGGSPDHGWRPPGVVVVDDDALPSGTTDGKHYRKINFRKGLVATDDGDRVDIDAAGGFGPFCYDYLIDKAFATAVSAGTYSEGDTFTSFTTHTFKVFSTIQAAIDDAEGVNGDDALSFLLCPGSYSENATINLANFTANKEALHFDGNELQNGVDWGNASSGDALVISGSHSMPLYFDHIRFRNPAAASSIDSGTGSTEIHASWCQFSSAVKGKQRVSTYIRCDFEQLGLISDAGETMGHVVFTSCNFFNIAGSVGMKWQGGGNDLRFVACVFPDADPIQITAGSYDNIVFEVCRFNVTGATPKRALVVNGTATILGLKFVNCEMDQPLDANGCIYFQTFTAIQKFIYIGNTHAKANGTQNPYIVNGHSTAILNSIILGNSFGRDSSSEFYNETEDTSKFSVSGKFEETVFGPNAPATIVQYSITSDNGTNEYYPPDSAIGADQPGQGQNVPHDILDGVTHQDSVADGVSAGSLIIGNDTPKWDELDISVPSGGFRNVLAIDNGETTPSWQDNDAVHVSLPVVGTPTFGNVEDLQRVFHSSGWVEGGVISVNSGDSTNIDVSAGDGVLRISDSVTAQIVFFDWAAITNQDITTNTARYIGVEYNSGSPQVVIHTSYDWNFTTDFPLGNVVNEDGTIHIENSPFEVGNHADLMNQRLFQTLPRVRDNVLGGLIVGETGTRNVTMSAGAMWDGLSRFPISALDTSVSGGFDTYSAGGKEATDATQWPNEQYDNAGTLTTMTNNRWANLYWYLELDGGLIMVYGTAQYTSAAIAGEESLPTTLPTRVTVQSRLIARFIFQKSASTAFEKLSAFTTQFSTTGVTDHGNLAGLADNDHSFYDHANVQAYAGASLALVDGLITPPATPYVLVTSETGATDNFAGISAGSNAGDTVRFTNTSGDTITVQHEGGEAAGTQRLFTRDGNDVVLDDVLHHWIEFTFISSLGWFETDRSVPATLTAQGFVELATAAEINTSTDATRAMSPGAFSDSNYGIRYPLLTIVAPTASVETGTNLVYFHIPPGLNGMELMYAHGEHATAGTGSGSTVSTIDINKNGATMLATKLTIDEDETGSDTAAAAVAFNTDGSEVVATNDVVSADVDGLVSATAPLGLVVTLGFRIP